MKDRTQQIREARQRTVDRLLVYYDEHPEARRGMFQVYSDMALMHIPLEELNSLLAMLNASKRPDPWDRCDHDCATCACDPCTNRDEVYEENLYDEDDDEDDLDA